MPLPRSPVMRRKTRNPETQETGNDNLVAVYKPLQKDTNVSCAPLPPKLVSVISEDEKSEAMQREGSMKNLERDTATADSGTDGTVKRLDDNIFAIWGGRSRTPSIDEDGHDQEQFLCKGGPGKSDCGLLVDPSKNGEAGIKCDKCKEWYHASCQKVPKAAVNAVHKYPMIHWFCAFCHRVVFDQKENGPNKLAERILSMKKRWRKKSLK